MQKVVIYTPAEDFWYNDPIGQKVAACFSGLLLVIIAVMIGYAVGNWMFPSRSSYGGSMTSQRHSGSSGIGAIVVSVIFGLAMLAGIISFVRA